MESKGVMGRVSAMMLAIASILGVINDLINPFLLIASYAISFLAITLCISIIVVCFPPLSRFLNNIPAPIVIKSFFKEYWAVPFIIGQLVFGVVLVGSHYLTQQSTNSGGVLASVFPTIKEWQDSISAIEKPIIKIEQNTNRSATAVESIDKKADNFKREVSEDPQKELMNRGVAWTNNSFGEALLRSDIAIIDLFIRGGWNIKSDYIEGNAIGHYVYLGDTSDSAAVNKIVDLFLKHGISMQEPISRFRGTEPTSLPAGAARACNKVLLEVLLQKGARVSDVRNELKKSSMFYISSPPDSRHSTECESNKKIIEKMLDLKEYFPKSIRY